MSTADIIIVLLIVLALGGIIAGNIIRKKKGGSPCSHCPSRKDCTSRTCIKDQKSGVKDVLPDENRTLLEINAKDSGTGCTACNGDCAACKSKSIDNTAAKPSDSVANSEDKLASESKDNN